MFTTELLALMLLSLPGAQAAGVAGVAAPVLTFQTRDPATGDPLECDRCPPGTYLRATCTRRHRSDCAPCPSGTFTELWNHIGKCLRCRACGQNQVVKTPCAAESDRQCECEPGFYFRRSYDVCWRHSECPPGQGVLTAGTPDENTVCQTCSNGTFSTTISAHDKCIGHRSCQSQGLKLVLKGCSWHDNVCTTCERSLGSTDGAHYLKEILPTFFAHAKMSPTHLQRIINPLPSKHVTKRMKLEALDARIRDWIATATAAEIRRLPKALMNAGANGLGKRLQHKLQRIDSNLSELCLLGNRLERL